MSLLNKLKNNREGLAYLFWGGVVTVVSIALFQLFMRLSLGVPIANTLSTIISVSLAYISNKLWVFRVKTHGVLALLKEALSFCTGRFLTYVLETWLLVLLIDKLHYNDTLCKAGTTALVIALNYLISKIFIFRKK